MGKLWLILLVSVAYHAHIVRAEDDVLQNIGEVTAKPEEVSPVIELLNKDLENLVELRDEMRDIEDMFAGDQETNTEDLGKQVIRHNSHHNHRSRSDQGSGEDAANQLAIMYKYLYRYCKTKVMAPSPGLKRINGGYYFFYDETQGPLLNWDQARDWCAARGMSLVNLETQAESNAVMSYLGQLLSGLDDIGYWTGGNDLSVEGLFLWLSAMGFDYTNWLANQPTVDPTLNCVEILKKDNLLQWTVIDCSAVHRFVCEVVNPCHNIFRDIRELKRSSSESNSDERFDNNNYIHEGMYKHLGEGKILGEGKNLGHKLGLLGVIYGALNKKPETPAPAPPPPQIIQASPEIIHYYSESSSSHSSSHRSSSSSDNNSGSSDNNSGSSDNNSGSSDNNSGSSDNNSGSSDNNSGSSDNNSGSSSSDSGGSSSSNTASISIGSIQLSASSDSSSS